MMKLPGLNNAPLLLHLDWHKRGPVGYGRNSISPQIKIRASGIYVLLFAKSRTPQDDYLLKRLFLEKKSQILLLLCNSDEQ